MNRIGRIDLHVMDGCAPLSVFRVTGARPGPTLAVIGAIHGDEYEGPLVLSGLLAEAREIDLSGTLVLVPVANRDAVAAATRCSPTDGKNLARVFPGNESGSYTDRLASLIHHNVIAPADAVLDLHSGGQVLASVFFAGFADDPGGVGARSRAMALAFGAPFVWRHDPPLPPGRTMSSCSALGKPGVYVEASGGTFPAQRVIDDYRRGVLGVMAQLQMLESEAPVSAPQIVAGSGDLDTTAPAPVTGICTAHVGVGEVVSAGQLLVSIADLDGTLLAEVRAPTDSIVMFIRRSRWVERGETLMALARRA